MGRAYRGPYARASTYPIPYATAAVWGTGWNEVHMYYGEGPPIRVTGRTSAMGASPVATGDHGVRDYAHAADASGMDPPQEVTWGYQTEDYGPDSFGSGADSAISSEDVAPGVYQDMDSRPAWNDPNDYRIREDTTDTQPAWGSSGERHRATFDGSHRFRVDRETGQQYEPIAAEPSNSWPTETVSEGWANKVTSFVADANPSADEQIFVQTSMRQRYLEKDNRRAVMRDTDEERHTIASRIMAMVEKVYSTGERLYDMYPYQIDQMDRPFRYRTAGLGPRDWMLTNASTQAITPVERTVPADPWMGVTEVGGDFASTYGYTGEDTMYYG